MTGSAGSTTDGSTPGAESPLAVQLEIVPHDEAGCVVANHDRAVAEVTQRLKGWHGGCDDCRTHCQAAITFENTEREVLTEPIGDRCVCPAFDRTDCVPELETVRDGALVVSLAVPGRVELRRTIDGLRDVGARVTLRRITTFDEDDEMSVEPDAVDVTSKQREAIEVAVAEGYYDAPRRTDLADLAGRLGISKSAVSQRLNTVEAKLVRSLEGEFR